MNKVMREIMHARPKLRIVSPISFWIILILAFFNLALGTTFLFGLDINRFSNSLLIVNSILTFQFWGVVFIAIGLVKLYSLWKNNWELARTSLIIGVSVKAAWMVGLTIRIFVSPGTFFVDLLWITVALIQMSTYIFFLPPSAASYKQTRAEREDE